jgi:hypothetical protein
MKRASKIVSLILSVIVGLSVAQIPAIAASAAAKTI